MSGRLSARPRAMVLAWLVAALPSPARADSGARGVVERCASTAERGEEERLAGRLRDARQSFESCSATICPDAVRRDCLRWQSEVQAELPTVILSARDARSREVTKVRVFANGELVADALDGTPISLDPGRCELRYESRSGASQTVVIDLAPGERDRRVSIRFDRALRPDGTGAPQIEETTTYTAGPDAPASLARPADEQREPNVLGYVFGAGALVTGSLFGYFEVEGQSRYHDMQAGCGRTQTCTQEQIGDARTDFVLAGSFLAAAVVSAGLATWQFLRPRGRSGTSRSAVRLVVPAPRGFVVRF